MTITWIQVEIQNGSGLPVAIGGQGDITLRNDSGLPIIILNGQSAGAPGVTHVSIAATQTADISRTPNVDLTVQVARYDFDDTPPIAIPGVIALSFPIRTMLSNANLTQLGAALPAGTQPTFSIAPDGMINTISLI
ncbi:hypothetical protein V5E97_24400 [Singulisphaera sp. Ch08]|uniref:Uncharacterized protein n=1 Tax=Singulisphaera sp. Ch08 TaxID=3120278 RepID=A0AAU7C9Q3_9BACT